MLDFSQCYLLYQLLVGVTTIGLHPLVLQSSVCVETKLYFDCTVYCSVLFSHKLTRHISQLLF